MRKFLPLFLSMFLLGMWTSCATPAQRRVVTETETRNANCAYAIQLMHRDQLGVRFKNCLEYGFQHVCLMGDPDCQKDLVGYCRIRAFRLLQFQIQQCQDSEDIDTFLKSLPSDQIIRPEDGESI